MNQRQNPMALPRLVKIVVAMGVKHALSDKKNIERSREALSQLTGQRPKTTRAKKSIASFKLREGDEIGLMVTLRGKRMKAFLQKLVTVVLPRLRDFHGVRRESFDGHGNYTLGFLEYAVFPEIDPGKLDATSQGQGLEVVIVTSAKSDKDGQMFLSALGMPFRKE